MSLGFLVQEEGWQRQDDELWAQTPAERERALDAADVRSRTLWHDDSPDDDASCPIREMWLRAAGVEGVDATRGPRFNPSGLVLEAAVLGPGIALAKSIIAARSIVVTLVGPHIHLSRALTGFQPQQAYCVRTTLPEWLCGLFA